MRLLKSGECANLVRAVVVLLALGSSPGCDRSEQVLEPATQWPEVPSGFPEFFLEKGTDADSSYISLRGLRTTDGVLEIHATSWGIRETGLFLARQGAPKSAVFVFMGECGTVSTRTWEKVTLRQELTAVGQDTLQRIVFISHSDTLELVKTHVLHLSSK